MLKKINDFLAGLPMTIVAGVFLLLDFFKVPFPFSPAWVAVVISGIPMLYLALWRVKHNKGISKISSALLISIAMFAAIAIGDLFAAGEVAFIMAIGAILEDMTTNRAKKGLTKLIKLAPDMGRRITDDKEEMITSEQILKGDKMRILPGEVIPADGIVINGQTSVNQAIMTGEALPIDKAVGDEVYCGTLNCYGSIDIKAMGVGENSSLKKLIRMVREAENKQAPMQRIADRAASILVPIALMIAIFAYLFTGNIVTGVTVLVVFCPCALVLATPTAVMAAIGQATKYGVIIKSGEALEKMGKVNTICFDKTGTLTYGNLSVSDIISSEMNNDELLALAASVELRSEHPLGRAIVATAKEKELLLLEPKNFRMEAGKGVYAKINGREIYCGNEKYIKENGIEVNMNDCLEKINDEGKACVIIADKNHILGIIALSDNLKEKSAATIYELNKINIKTVLLTGDNQGAANYFADLIGIGEVRAELLPDEKVEAIREIQQNGNMVCMIGDGVNDAPALKTADVSAAMGSMGSDIAIEAADIALMGDDITKVVYLKRLSNATVSTIKLSITISMCINFVAIVLSVAGVLNPTTGALVHNAGSCFVVLIAALLYDRKF